MTKQMRLEHTSSYIFNVIRCARLPLQETAQRRKGSLVKPMRLAGLNGQVAYSRLEAVRVEPSVGVFYNLTAE